MRGRAPERTKSYRRGPLRPVADPLSPDRRELAAEQLLQAISVAKVLAIYVGSKRGTVAEAGPKMAAAPAIDPNDMGVCRFIADTVCGYNLVGKDRVKRANAEAYIRNLDKRSYAAHRWRRCAVQTMYRCAV